ncbi:hypothetical protein BKA70DRAFT_1228185 [Coprinopsis sp. MPI-PUGE-AT-0042]|nr:hypothetical protein BKA70DRAFT_1228185 [Coprinopsis sp. MPI-PUGE-AT-0042]
MALRTEKKRMSKHVMRAIGGLSSYDSLILLSALESHQVPLNDRDLDTDMDVDSDGSIEATASSCRNHRIPNSFEQPPIPLQWDTRYRRVVQEGAKRWSDEELRIREEIIKKKAMVISCQRRRINRLKRRLQETKDRLFMADEMQGLNTHVVGSDPALSHCWDRRLQRVPALHYQQASLYSPPSRGWMRFFWYKQAGDRLLIVNHKTLAHVQIVGHTGAGSGQAVKSP